MRTRIFAYLFIILVMLFQSSCSETEDPVKIYNRGARAYNDGNYTEAIAMFKMALKKQREYSLPMIGLAKCYLHFAQEDIQLGNKSAAIKDIEEALYWIKQAIDADPGNKQAIETKQKILRFREEL